MSWFCFRAASGASTNAPENIRHYNKEICSPRFLYEYTDTGQAAAIREVLFIALRTQLSHNRPILFSTRLCLVCVKTTTKKPKRNAAPFQETTYFYWLSLFMHFWALINLQTAKESINSKNTWCCISSPPSPEMSDAGWISGLRQHDEP